MKYSLEQKLYAFLARHLDPSRSLLLGLSGGPDSLTLFHLLMAYKEKNPLHLGIAHVDHGWRTESKAEAEQLARLASHHALPFHLHLLDPQTLSGNLEAACRQERLTFFKGLCEQKGYQAVLLGHHADDQAETILKRLFEGANFTHLTGLQEKTEVEEVVLWRPLLNVRRREIEAWLKTKGIEGFHDKTNEDPRFLRARCRTQLMPYLAQTFGKEIAGNLCHLAETTQELNHFLEEVLDGYMSQIERTSLGSTMDFSAISSPFAIKYLLRKWWQLEGLSPTRDLIERAARLLIQGKKGRLVIGGRVFHVERKQLFIPSMKSSLFIVHKNNKISN